MADVVGNRAKGAVHELAQGDATVFLVALLKAAEADSAIVDHDDVSALLGAAGNTEADFTNYARKTGVTATITIDDANDRVDLDIPDQTWTSAGGTTDNTLVKLVVGYEVTAADSGRIPCTLHDFAVTTDGSDLTAQINASGFYRAA